MCCWGGEMYNIIVGTLIVYQPGDNIFYESLKTPLAQFVFYHVDLRFVRRSGYAYARASARRATDADGYRFSD